MEPDMMETETPNYFSFLGQQAPKKKRKRGGLAGIWDRNKKIIAPVVSGALGLVPGVGGVLAPLAGAAMRGLDRPGKRGIGFDVKRGLRGAAEGALAGGAARGLGRVLGGSGAGAAGVNPATMAEPATSMSRNAAFETAAQPSMMGRASTVAGRLGEAGQRGLGRALQFVNENPQATGMGLQALSGIMGSQEQRRIEEARLREERRRAENLAQLAMPLYLESFRGR